MVRIIKQLVPISLLVLLVACGDPEPSSGTNTGGFPYEEQLQSVQAGVDQFQEQNGVLPIKTFDETMTDYERYQVDFRQLVPGYMHDAPASAYENGGNFYYTLIDVENDPEVRVIPVLVMHEANQFEREVNDYTRTHGYPPLDEMVAPGIFALDYEAMGLDEQPVVSSPYFSTTLPLYLDRTGQVVIDYAIDLNRVLQEYDGVPEDESDIRSILTDEFPIAPVYSVPYELDNGEPKITGKNE
ncbi:ABC transporter periplasmic binding protein YphF [Geomicrobium sp. JCM 19037]|uniref:hypothetical protein n=1 Tax=Geomicrobium sp. JCM 19037 TaxID=1460634 RepID=UPI00045F2B81|nr:hypothetical protein [Geomicrobium sp. JCM 19037]GAK02408.1 ABC transporter periplasmic binding protein YphF [Geomicrobium sp. JCM 19037]